MSRAVTKSLKSLPTMTNSGLLVVFTVPVPGLAFGLVSGLAPGLEVGEILASCSVCSCCREIKRRSKRDGRTFVLFSPVTSSRGGVCNCRGVREGEVDEWVEMENKEEKEGMAQLSRLRKRRVEKKKKKKKRRLTTRRQGRGKD